MHYELYVDSLILLNFVMNLYLLLLVNKKVHSTATRGRLLLGAGLSSVFYVLPLLCEGEVGVRYVIGVLLGMSSMIFVPFPIHTFRAFRQVFEYLLWYSFLLGGCLLFFIKIFPGFAQFLSGSLGVMGMGAIVFLLLFYRREDEEESCKVTIKHEGRSITLLGFWDSGNSLIEPISKAPVCVVESKCLEQLWDNEPEYYRVIPYRTIDKRGYLKGFQLDEMQVELYGMKKTFQRVYIAQSTESIVQQPKGSRKEGMKMDIILNPMLLQANK